MTTRNQRRNRKLAIARARVAELEQRCYLLERLLREATGDCPIDGAPMPRGAVLRPLDPVHYGVISLTARETP